VVTFATGFSIYEGMRNWKTRNDNPAGDDEDDIPKIISIEKNTSDVGPQGNKIYFYSDVTRDTVLNLNRQIDELTKQMKSVQFNFSLPEPPRIEIHICSDGGDIFAAMSSVDKIADNAVPVDTYCEGMVASAATLLSAIGCKRYITKSSCMLVHQVSSGLWGNYAEFKDEIQNLELIMKLIKGVYHRKTKFNPTELETLLSHDLYLSAEECLKHGLVDKIL
jgi:ATP-dependent Clp endopeptidase proteolytic subunit ClpP